MFQRLDELQTGSLYILTGQAGAGKSHLASSARRSGTLWVLDTEGAAKSLSGKQGVHRRIQVVQTLSLKALVEAMDEVRKQGKAGDTVILDSISKVFQAMRAYAQRRAGAETDHKTGLGYDEHASINRNMQALYTGLTELKQAGFHVIVIGHLGRKYRAQNEAGGLQDDGLRVLADEQITYEADAILLVEREGEERAITPIIKPPRPAHLKLNKRYAATLGTLYPDMVPDGEAAAKGKARGAKPAAVAEEPDDEPELLDETEQVAAHEAAPVAQIEAAPAPVAQIEAAPTPVAEVEAAPTPVAAPRPSTPAPTHEAPRDPVEAERRFFARYSDIVGGSSWTAVQHYLQTRASKPTTVDGWISAAEQVRDQARGSQAMTA